jgi:hypothetical protein
MIYDHHFQRTTLKAMALCHGNHSFFMFSKQAGTFQTRCFIISKILQLLTISSHTHIYLWRKVVIYVLQLWDPPNWNVSDRVLGVFGKLSTRRGAWAWLHDIQTCDAKVLEYWMIFSLKIKWNHSWNFLRNWNVPLVLLERSWLSRI